MIIGIVGKMGMGKTSLMVYLAGRYWKTGKTYYSDIWIKSLVGKLEKWSFEGAFFFWLGLRKGRYMIPSSNYREFEQKGELYAIPSGSVALVDEAPVYFDSKARDFLPLYVRKKITDSRKDGIDLWWSAQRLRSVSTDLRENTHIYIDVYSLPLLPYGWLRLYLTKEYSDINENCTFEGLKPYRKRWYLLRKKHLDSYDTYQKIHPEMSDVPVENKEN